MNVFDFDNALFRDLFNDRGVKPYLTYARYHISDHRPLWAQFRVRPDDPIGVGDPISGRRR
jgi:hypothetical protein